MLSHCFMFLIFVLRVDSLEIDLHYRNEFLDGERRYSELVRKAQSYGDCWKAAISDLRSVCKRLTEDSQSRLALSFSSCFLTQAGLEPCQCARDVPISDCLKNSSDRMFSTYTEFFTHTHSICHYLQQREWQEEASKTVLELIEYSQLVNKKMDDASKSQSKIIDLQQAALNEQKQLISNGRILKAELQHSRQNARDMYQEFKTVTEEQRYLLFEVFDRLRNLQNFVLGEFTGVYSVVYHAIVMILVYILTSVPRTAGARVWLILVTLLSAASERILTTYTLQEYSLEGVDGILSTRIWLCRKLICLIALFILAMTYYYYKDYNVINNQLLQEIQHQNKELLSFMKGLGFQQNVFQHHIIAESSNNHSLVPSRTVKQKTGTKSLLTSCQILENKENVPLNSTMTTVLTGNLKKTSRREHPKKIISPGISSPEGSVLSELESSMSKRYNLRSSSRLNSPQSSPFSGQIW